MTQYKRDGLFCPSDGPKIKDGTGRPIAVIEARGHTAAKSSQHGHAGYLTPPKAVGR